MIDNFKNKWAMLSPKAKTFSMWGGAFFLIIVAIFGLSDEPIKKVQTVFSESEKGAFEVDDRSVTMEALGTQLKATREEMNLLKEQFKSTNSQLLKAREVINTLSGSDQNVRTINELTSKMQSLEQKMDNVTTRQDYFTKSPVLNDEPFVINNEGEIKSTPKPYQAIPVAQSSSVINDAVSKTPIPDDPLAFIKSVSQVKQPAENGENQYINSGETAAPYSPPGKIEIVNSSESNDPLPVESDNFDYVGERLLAGSLIPIIVVTGVDAPTGKAAEKGAISSTVRVTGPAILPNGYRVDLTGCLVTNEVRGDTATERAYFRPDRLTCRFEFGDVDVPIKAYVTGKDGSQGFRGTLVSKQGAALLYGTISGGVGGIGKSFGGGNNNTNSFGISTGSQFQLPSGSQIMQASGSGMVSESADFLSDYYKQKLDELYEVIEIKPLITGSIHILSTFDLELLDKKVKKAKSNG